VSILCELEIEMPSPRKDETRKDFVEHIFNKVESAHDIDSVRYEGNPNFRQLDEMKAATPMITIDWENILPEPPANSSSETKKDLKYLQDKTRSLSEKEVDLIMDVDETPQNLFKDYCQAKQLPYPTEMIEEILEQIDTVITTLKYKHRRARPEQIAHKMGYVVSVIRTRSHQTPAYPSGHQMHGTMTGLVLSDIYPEHTRVFERMEDLSGLARILQGVHFKGDNDASKALGRELWKTMKENILISKYDPFTKWFDNEQ
jgi:hypothetical protein